MKTDPRPSAAGVRPKAPSKARDRQDWDKTSPRLRKQAQRNLSRKAKKMKRTGKTKRKATKPCAPRVAALATALKRLVAGPLRRTLLALLGVALAAVLLTWGCRGASGAMSDCLDATCRITASDNGRGTGCVFEINRDHVYVLTAAHVVGEDSAVRCEFWRAGHQSQPITGQVLTRVLKNDIDAAVITIPQTAFGGVLPRVVPVAAPDLVLRPGDTITSVGCANGNWSTGWKGHVLGYSGTHLEFVPSPAQGRSGSAIFDADGTHIVGVIRARTMDNQQGLACSVQALYGKLGYPAADRTQCGPGGCPVGPDYRLLPYRQKMEFQLWQGQQQAQNQQSQGNPWPTMPLPSTANIDLAETNRKLDRIAELIQRARPAQPVVPPTTPAAADPRVESAEKTAKEAGTAVSEVKQEQSKLREGLSQVHSVLQSLTGDATSLPERIHARLEKVKGEGAEGTREVLRAYVKDLVTEKVGDGSAGLTIGKVVGGALGVSGPVAAALAGGLWLVSRRLGRKIRSGEPLLIHQALAHLSDKLEAIKTRVQDKTS